jgi:uncharacterized membrane protein
MSAILDFDEVGGRRLACGRVTRVEAFSDAVLAIAITLLVVELPFDKVGEGELGHALGDHWARFAAYALSFIGIGILWLHHHAILSAVSRIDRRLVLLNLLVLFAAAFLPFPTSLVGDYLSGGGEDARIAMVLYSGTWVAVTAAAAIMCRHIARTPDLLAADVDSTGVRRLYRNLAGAAAAYLVFTLVALASPVATIACYGVAAVFFLVTSDFRALGKSAVEKT